MADIDYPMIAAEAPVTNPPAFHALAPDLEKLANRGIYGFVPTDPRARSFVFLRSQLVRRFQDNGGRVLGITSTQGDNGKTFVSTNIAATLSRSQPTVLIDMDLHRVGVARRFGIRPALGVCDYLSGEASLSEIGIRIQDTELTLFPGRSGERVSASSFPETRLAELFAEVRDAVPDATILVDMPPVLTVDDVLLMLPFVDALVLVVEEGRTGARDMREVLRLIDPKPVLGTILNKSLTGGRRPAYYSY